MNRGPLAGKRSAVLATLEARPIALTDTQRERVLACEDEKRLDAWIIRAATAAEAGRVFD